jgi:hypothetical protein
MAKISTYPQPTPPQLSDYVLGTDVSDLLATKNFILSDIITLATTTGQFVTKVGVTLPTYANNAAAISGGLAVNSIYKTSTGEVRIVV